MGTTTTNLGLYKPAVGETGWGASVNASLDTIDTVAGSVFNVRKYGAIGNGSTDDTASFQAAITAATTAGGGRVYVPPGNYVITRITLAQEIWLDGDGWNSVLTCNNSNPNASMILVPSTANYTRVSNLYLNGNKGNQTTPVTGYSVAGGTGNPHHMIDNCFVYNFKTRGIEVLTNGLVTRIFHNWVYGCDGEGIFCAGADSIISDNNVANSGLEGILVSGWNCKTNNNKPFFSGQITAARGIGIKITGSNHQSVNDEPQDNLADGWHLDTCTGTVIMGGNIGDNAGAAIKITAGSYHRIQCHAGGGVRTLHASVLNWATSPANCFVDVTYNPATIGANPPNVGTIPASNHVRLGQAWLSGTQTISGAYTGSGMVLSGTFTDYGIDFNGTYTRGPLRLKNNVYVLGRNAADTADVNMFGLDTSDTVAFNVQPRFNAGFTVASGFNMNFSTGTGTKIGSATGQKIGFWNATPVIQPAGWGSPTGTATRTTFDTTSVTLPQLAERVRGLIDDLKTIGLLGG